MTRPRYSVIALLVTAGLSGAVQASSVESDATRAEARASEGVETAPARTQHWDLSDAEWERYDAIMEGPRGLWSPDLDPIWVLGIHAETERERRYYAELAVEQERDRVTGELAFQHAYDAAWDRLYPDRVLIEPRDRSGSATGATPRMSEPSTPTLDDLRADDRVVLVAARDCNRCGDILERAVERLQDGAQWRLDVFLTDTDADQEVRRWAAENAVPIDLVRAGRITLNHDDGTLADHDTPSLLRQSGQRWQPVLP
ncbi:MULTISPECIES: TIGR03759 family integrating conjugative element protein [unclassified Thioalkalivibrio]|uniref:TIGR03759 family integrating conjugative element protein n=1 Tax=unclassified Thioalkalivibrio TaxID=2621013 RepID=UPI00036FB3D9|nr:MULTISPECIES: TIGR03759 family integrating conjugative element protein [unclassified Thioalkalivibrio]